MAQTEESKRGDVEQLKGILTQFDRLVWYTALEELGVTIAAKAAYQVKTFKKISFEPEAEWTQSEPEDGCITYTTTGGLGWRRKGRSDF